MRRTLTLVLLAALFFTGACGDDDDGGAAEDAHADARCERVGQGGGTPVAVALDEWSITPAPTSASGGKVTFTASNDGEEPHELVIVRGARSDLSIKDGTVNEDALPGGAFIGEIEAFPAGEDCEGTFDLTAGNYVLFCNIAEEHDGELESHVENGMLTTFTVS